MKAAKANENIKMKKIDEGEREAD